MNYITTDKYIDGFGAQYQRIIICYIFSKFHNLIFHYRPFESMEHNYNNNPLFINQKELLINLKENVENINNRGQNNYIVSNGSHTDFFEKNINLCCESPHMAFIKKCFWENKERDFFKNGKMNVAVHIRRLNSNDGGIGNAGERVTTPNSYYLLCMKKIRSKYPYKNILFHIYSQGNSSDFSDLVGHNNLNVELNLNSDVESTFTGMVAADVLIMSPSSLSYVAALISDGEIWYKKFWHGPRKDWIVYA